MVKGANKICLQYPFLFIAMFYEKMLYFELLVQILNYSNYSIRFATNLYYSYSLHTQKFDGCAPLICFFLAMFLRISYLQFNLNYSKNIEKYSIRYFFGIQRLTSQSNLGHERCLSEGIRIISTTCGSLMCTDIVLYKGVSIFNSIRYTPNISLFAQLLRQVKHRHKPMQKTICMYALHKLKSIIFIPLYSTS